LLLDYFVALTAGLFELCLVENLNLAPAIVNKTCFLQKPAAIVTLAPGSQHLPEQILR